MKKKFLPSSRYPNKVYKHRVNERIRAKEVRVIDPNGKQLGIMNIKKALELAYSMGLDLVEVAPKANPPVVKIMDYGKYLYLEKKKQKESKKQVSEVKEIELRPNISDHDLMVKVKKMREFLEDGNKVKVRVFFRGREIVHKDKGYEVIQKITETLSDIAEIDLNPKMEGRNLVCILKPSKKARKES